MCVTSILTLLQLINIYILFHLLWINCTLLTTLSELSYTSNDCYIMEITYTSIILDTYTCCKYDQNALYEYVLCISSIITVISLYTLPHKHAGCYIIENT